MAAHLHSDMWSVLKEDIMKNAVQKNFNLGDVVAEAFVLRGAKAAAEFASQVGRTDLAEKISWGQFTAPTGAFTPRRAAARAEALRRLPPVKKAA
jgi:hypothetical protein